MGVKFPFTNMQQLNLDWILKRLKLLPENGKPNQVLTRVSGGAEWRTLTNQGVVAVDSVNGKTGVVVLDKDDIGLTNVENVQQYSATNPPPYPVTSVNTRTGDVIITAQDIGAVECIYPQYYGAECDGVTDDSAALQAAINGAAALNKPLYINADIFIDSDITIPSTVRIKGMRNNEATPWIIVGSNCTTALTFSGVRNIIEDIGIKANGDAYMSNVNAMEFVGNTNGDIDSVVDNVSVVYLDTAIKCGGRNLDVINCLFSHCRVGVFFSSNITGMRGWSVENCRFHGIGEEAALNWFNNSYCIYVSNNKGSNVTIRNNICDQSGTFLYGFMSNGLIENNFLECFAKIMIDIAASDGTTVPQNNGSILISGNYINGKSGQVAQGVTADYPTYNVQVNGFNRVILQNNVIGKSQYESVIVSGVVFFAGVGNEFQANGTADNTKTTAYALANSKAYLLNNTAFNTGMTLFSAGASVSVSTGNNVEFDVPTTGFTSITSQEWVYVGQIKSNNAISITLPNEFFVRVPSYAISFHCFKNADGIACDSVCWQSATVFFGLQWQVSGNTITPILRRYDITTMAGTTPPVYGYNMDVYTAVNI